MNDPSASRPALRIAIYAGPTGGHLFPAQAFAERLRERAPGAGVELVTSRRARKLVANMPAGLFDRVRYLPDFGLPHRVFSVSTLKPLLLAPWLFVQAFAHLWSFRPRLCVGFGSFVAYPGMIAAGALGIPTLIHEQNRAAGKATCWLAPRMKAVAVSFEDTLLPPGVKNIRRVGLPLRKFITQRPSAFREPGVTLRLLVMGGSQGAQGLNRIVTAALGSLDPEEKEKIAVTHIAGEKDRDRVAGEYQAAGVTSEIHPFYRDMFELFHRTDLAVTRAGANTLFELAFYGIPAFVVPFPYAGGHQKLNAEAFARKGGLEYREESPGAEAWLASRIRAVLKGEKRLEPMAEAMSALAKPKAAEELANIALGLIR